MGCWDETCALTNTPIFEGEPCVKVVIKKKSWLPRPDYLYPDDVLDIQYGEYDGYGRVENNDLFDSQEHEGTVWRIFFHRDVWDEIQEKYEIDTSNHTLYGGPDIAKFFKVLVFASDARRNIFGGYAFAGQQECCGSKPYELVLEMGRRHLPEKIENLISEYPEEMPKFPWRG